MATIARSIGSRGFRSEATFAAISYVMGSSRNIGEPHKEFIQRKLELSFVCEDRDFQQTDGAHRNGFRVAHSGVENSHLFPRQPFHIDRPADEDMRIEQEAWEQRYLKASQR
ncbi:MAG: hypothetical protein ACRD4O_14455 [Bryobacteraceae bacterium]